MHPNLSPVASLIADPTRAAMLVQLFDGAARTAGELAYGAGVSPQVASNHLARLLTGGFLSLEVQGRHRYYRLAGAPVAQVLEALASLDVFTVSRAPEHRTAPRVPPELRFARTCYDHLAGELGVTITGALLERGVLVDDGLCFEVSPEGEQWLSRFSVPVGELRRARRAFTRRCLDWSERRVHLGGALGMALLMRMQEIGWVVPVPRSRALRLTVAGTQALEQEFGLALHARRQAS